MNKKIIGIITAISVVIIIVLVMMNNPKAYTRSSEKTATDSTRTEQPGPGTIPASPDSTLRTTPADTVNAE